jgi:hypothetical protein
MPNTVAMGCKERVNSLILSIRYGDILETKNEIYLSADKSLEGNLVASQWLPGQWKELKTLASYVNWVFAFNR